MGAVITVGVMLEMKPRKSNEKNCVKKVGFAVVEKTIALNAVKTEQGEHPQTIANSGRVFASHISKAKRHQYREHFKFIIRRSL
jgi:hypothetical protein